MAVDFAALDRETFASDSLSKSRLTPEILGRIVAVAWQIAGAKPQDDMVEGDMFSFLLRDDLDPPPESIRNALHIERRADGNRIEERTRLIVGAQSADAIGRLNPSHVPPVHKTDLVQANLLLRQHELDYPDEVKWIRNAIDKHFQK